MRFCSENNVLQVLRMGVGVWSGAECGRRGAVKRFKMTSEAKHKRGRRLWSGSGIVLKTISRSIRCISGTAIAMHIMAK